jgi:hypothetical protein
MTDVSEVPFLEMLLPFDSSVPFLSFLQSCIWFIFIVDEIDYLENATSNKKQQPNPYVE